MSGRRSIEIAGYAHANPVPAASRIGPFLASGVITARDLDSGEMPVGLDAQCAVVFDRVRSLMAAAGGSTDDILKLTLWVSDYRDRDAINREWCAMFPDAATRPARQVMQSHLDGGALVHADVWAVLSGE